MKFKNFLKNDNAVAVSIGFILMFAVTVFVFCALIISFYTITQSTQKSAMQESFKIIGSELAAKITSVDTLINITNSYGGTVNTLEYEFTLPASIADKSYTMNITNSSYEIIMQSDNGARTVTPLNISTNVTGITIYSGAENYELIYDRFNNSLNIKEQ